MPKLKSVISGIAISTARTSGVVSLGAMSTASASAVPSVTSGSTDLKWAGDGWGWGHRRHRCGRHHRGWGWGGGWGGWGGGWGGWGRRHRGGGGVCVKIFNDNTNDNRETTTS
jgi:hypothetical protein